MPRKPLVISALALACAVPAGAQARPLIDPAAGEQRPAPAVAAHDHFEWGDAGVGAAGTFLLLASAGAGAVVVRRRRDQRVLAG
jgi:hypothetical protein